MTPQESELRAALHNWYRSEGHRGDNLFSAADCVTCTEGAKEIAAALAAPPAPPEPLTLEQIQALALDLTDDERDAFMAAMEEPLECNRCGHGEDRHAGGGCNYGLITDPLEDYCGCSQFE